MDDLGVSIKYPNDGLCLSCARGAFYCSSRCRLSPSLWKVPLLATDMAPYIGACGVAVPIARSDQEINGACEIGFHGSGQMQISYEHQVVNTLMTRNPTYLFLGRREVYESLESFWP